MDAERRERAERDATAALWWMVPLWGSTVGRWEKTGWAVGFVCAVFFGLGVGYFVDWAIGVAVGFGLAMLGRWVGRLHDEAERAKSA
jgi:hypothetical protein